MKLFKSKILAGAAISLVTLAGCGINTDDTTSEETEDSDSIETTSSTGVSGDSASSDETAALENAEDVSALGLSKAFNLKLPKAIDSSDSAALFLQEGRKSMEACMMGDTVKEATGALAEVGNFFCHIEAEKDKIKFNEKVRIVFEGQEFAKIWVQKDNVNKRVRIGFCSDDEYGQNSEIIEIVGVSDNGPLGAIINQGSYEDEYEGEEIAGSWHRSVEFDMTEEDSISLKVNDNHKQNDDKFTRRVGLNLVEDGVSEILLASKGTWGGGSFAERGIALFDGSHGNAVFQTKGSHEGQEFSFTRKGFFDDDGNVVGEDESEEFASGGDLHITEEDLPKYLADDFKPADLDGWVGDGCPDYDVEVELDPESEEHQACDGDRDDDNHSDCWNDENFEQGEEIDADVEAGEKEVEEFEEVE